MASSLVWPQTMESALKPAHTLGRDGELKIAHFKSSVKWIHLMPAGLPCGIPGIDEDIDGTMQHAPQLSLQLINPVVIKNVSIIGIKIKNVWLSAKFEEERNIKFLCYDYSARLSVKNYR
jgi:hypothetical protein